MLIAYEMGNAVLQLESPLAMPSAPSLPGCKTPPRDADGLIDYLLSHYHADHRRQLPELVRLARRVESVHASSPQCPCGLADRLEGLWQELESHMRKEELLLFPLLRQGSFAQAAAPVALMRYEHEQHAAALEGMRQLTGGFVPPPEACHSWRTLYEGLAAFGTDLEEHMRLENQVLFAFPAYTTLEGAKHG